MVKIIIVDDEEFSLKAIARYITHTRKDIVISGLFKNAREALDYLNENSVDIVITDIKMPVVSGIDLAKHVRNNFPLVRVIFISAYSDFEYAQQAISLGVEQYLVKPVDVNELSLMLDKIIDSIIKEKQASLERKKELDRYNSLLFWAKKDLYIDILSGLLVDDDEILKRADCIGLSSEEIDSCHGALIIKLNESSNVDYNEDEYHLSISNLMSKFKNVEDFVVLYQKRNAITLIVRISPKFSIETAKHYLTSEYEKIRSEENDDNALNYTMDITYFCSSLIELKNYKDVINNSQFLQIKFRDLSSSIFAGENEKSREIFSNVLYYAYTLNFPQAKSLMVMLFDNLKNSFELAGINFDITYDKQSITKCTNMDGLSDTSKHILDKIIDFRKLSSHGLESLTIEKAKDYIKSHYMCDLALDEIASHVNLSSFYFSKFFKSKIGKTLTEYITEIRINKAIEMIKEKKYKLYEISEKCGYRSRKYFTHSFKQYTGYTPSEYQRIINVKHTGTDPDMS